MHGPVVVQTPQGARARHERASLETGEESDKTVYEGNPEEQVQDLALRITREASAAEYPSLFDLPPGSDLDPKSQNFNAERWTRAFYQTSVEALDGTEPNTAGLSFQNLNVHGHSALSNYQTTIGNSFHAGMDLVAGLVGRKQPQRVDVLRDLEGVMLSGEMLCVLGPPGSGCSTFLKTLACETYGFTVDKESRLNYQGLAAKDIQTRYQGEAIYVSEVDHHFPRLTAGETLYFAARARCPRKLKSRKHEYAEQIRDVVMAMLGISHTKNTRVGNDFIRGVSGGERKRVSIAEAVLSYSPWQFWDNSTRGLDSANAVEFCRTLRTQAKVFGNTACVAIYQAPQEAYDLFDKVILLYEGRQIFFGKTAEAKAYFEGLGFLCPEQQTTPDFLTSMTSASERTIRPGWQGKPPPRSPDEFAKAWKESSHRQRLCMDIASFQEEFPLGGAVSEKFEVARAGQKSTFQRPGSPYTLSIGGQLALNLWRAWRLLLSDPGMTITMLVTNFFESIIISSIFYNLSPDSSSMDKRNLLIFFAIAMNALGSLLEVLTLYEKRKIVEKHRRYALYHPSVEAVSSMIMDLPYNGFTVPQNYLHDWIGWLRWINPIFYIQESLSLNEFVGRHFPCDGFIPNGPTYDDQGSLSTSRVCSVKGAAPGESFIEGAEHLRVVYGFIDGHLWRNLGIVLGLTLFYTICHLLATELIMSEQSKGEILIFPRNTLKKMKGARPAADEETTHEAPVSHVINGESPRREKVGGIAKQQSTFHWKNICYELNIKGERRTILDHVDGWVKPGTLTALMGVSGAGKTTLLDALACRITMGVVTGDAFVDGKPRTADFQRKTGYATQQDLHLGTATVREALEFSALLRQPDKYSKQEKLDYVNEVIELVDLQDCANAVIGVLGEGLNVEQRKRLTIGIELAARPELLLFLDEPTSGLDSQTSWAICNLMEKLTNNGQAILCTIHQPSASLFQRFDRLLLLARGGRTVYFGEVGRNSATLIDYLQRNGAPPFKDGLNPAEYMLDVIGATARSRSKDVDWPTIWRNSPEYQEVQAELARGIGASVQYWRTPEYIMSKTVMTAGCALFIGLAQVNAEMTERGLYNQMLFVYFLLVIFGQIIEQTTPMFMTQRTLYEARERHAKTYSWVAFLCGTMTAEIMWNSLMAVFSFLLFYFPLGLYRNAEHTGAVHSRGIAMFLNIWAFFVFSTTFGFLISAGIDTAEVSGGIVNLFFIMMFAFAGVLAGPDELPRFWIFMYRVNPFTYIVEALVATSLADAPVSCIDSELLTFEAPSGQSCDAYLGPYMRQNGGYLAGESSGSCSYCPTAQSNSFLTAHGLYFDNRWRDFGLVWAYCLFNILGAIGMYWLLRVPKGKKVRA
uniref:ABC transporter domain-containing protein n=1 Tax=Pyricularia oryzae (strain P131) TaxID=1143193 RepID=L7IWL3_PYRO1